MLRKRLTRVAGLMLAALLVAPAAIATPAARGEPATSCRAGTSSSSKMVPVRALWPASTPGCSTCAFSTSTAMP